MGFDADAVVEPLEYDFKKHGKKGTIKEPSDRQIAQYMSAVKELVKDLQGKIPEALTAQGPDVDLNALFMAVDDLDPEVVVKFHQDMAGMFSKLCSGDPTKAELLAVPIRIRVMFYDWLQREVMSPEAAPGAGSNVTKLPARAG